MGSSHTNQHTDLDRISIKVKLTWPIFKGEKREDWRVRTSEQKLVICWKRHCSLRPGPSLKTLKNASSAQLWIFHLDTRRAGLYLSRTAVRPAPTWCGTHICTYTTSKYRKICVKVVYKLHCITKRDLIHFFPIAKQLFSFVNNFPVYFTIFKT